MRRFSFVVREGEQGGLRIEVDARDELDAARLAIQYAQRFISPSAMAHDGEEITA